jgi:Polyketide cyclase / dehydrase and lipid transport
MRNLIRIAAALAALSGLILLVGILLPSRHTASAHVHVRADPDAVWAVLAAVEDYPSWRSDVSAAEILSAKSGLIWHQTDARGKVMMHTEGANRPGEKWTDRLTGGDPGIKGERVFLLVGDSSGGCTIALTETLELKDPLARFKARFVTGYAKDLKKLLSELAKRLGG